MGHNIYASLAWLPSAPVDFSTRCKFLLNSPQDLGKQLRMLASYSLDENQLNSLARILRKAQAGGVSLAPLTPFRLGILSNSTTEFLVPVLVASALRHGLALECVVAPYGQVIQQALSPDSVINSAKPDAVLLAVDYRGYPLNSPVGDADAAALTASNVLAQIETIRSGLRNNANCVVIVQNLAPPPEVLLGSLDKVVPGTLRGTIEEVNLKLAHQLLGSSDILFDLAGLASTVGLAEWHCPSQWNMAKFPFSANYLPLYGDYMARTIAAMRGKSRRCLILDLDNTLWGGIIGDDGLEGIKLAQGDATGEAFLAVQRYVLELRQRGVVLAVSSKNHDEVARSPFRQHPEMILHEDHFAVFQANWDDKASNIKAIAEELSLGLESMVFLDDNPVERGIVRSFLPEVAVPELPNDPALYPRTLSAAGYFEATIFSSEDGKRADFYQDNARRVSLQKQFGDVGAYLASLNMVITFQPFDDTGRVRITQLINKSNQYNLTTRRYTEAEVAAVEHDPDAFTLQVRLADCFGDNGMISVVICRRSEPDLWDIDTWLMSCRVLGRRVEHMVLAELLRHAKLAGISRLQGRFIPTGRNQLVTDHYDKLNFSLLSREASGASHWEIDVSNATVDIAPMEVRRFGLDRTAVAA